MSSGKGSGFVGAELKNVHSFIYTVIFCNCLESRIRLLLIARGWKKSNPTELQLWRFGGLGSVFIEAKVDNQNADTGTQ